MKRETERQRLILSFSLLLHYYGMFMCLPVNPLTPFSVCYFFPLFNFFNFRNIYTYICLYTKMRVFMVRFIWQLIY